MKRDRAIGRSLLWGGLLLLVTVVLVSVRDVSEQIDVPITFLLVVLGGSASGGRRLGFALACASFLIIDYYLQVPYNQLSFGKSNDFITLAAFLVTAGAASELLARARRDRDEAVRRADEVTALSRLTENISALREADRMKDFVLASVSHDLRTPLTSIKALAQDEQRTGAMRAPEIEEQADRLSRMVADLLDLSRLRAGTFAVTPELNSAEDVVGAAIRQCAPLALDRIIRAELDESAPALYGTFDFVQTLRVLANLLENALRYTPAGGEVVLGLRREEQQIVLSVSDRGPGIVVAEQERVFDAFYRPAGSLGDQGRAGLGLAIARTIAAAQGGSLTYLDREGGGSTFELRLPAVEVDQGAFEES